MNSIFSPDSKLMQALSRASDLIILNLIFLLCCVPVFTVGAALTAMYSVLFPLGTRRDKGIVRAFFRAFSANFRQGTVLWLIFLLVSAALGFDMMLAYRFLPIFCIPLIILVLLAVLTEGFVFPLLSLFENSIGSTVKNAFALSLGNLPRALLIAALNAFPLILFAVNMLFFFYAAFIWVVVYFSAAAYINTLLLRKVFAPYMPEDSFTEDYE